MVIGFAAVTIIEDPVEIIGIIVMLHSHKQGILSIFMKEYGKLGNAGTEVHSNQK